MAKKVTVDVTNQGAVYINDTRITGRDTKWGQHTILFTAKVSPDQVSKTLTANGYGHIRFDPAYAADAGVQ